MIGGANSVYESFDQGSTLVEVGPGLPVVVGGRQPIAYGAPGTAYVANSIGVFQTRDAGTSWTEITGDLPDRGAVPPLRSLAYVPRTDDDDDHGHHGHGDRGKDLLLVGTTDGAYFAKENQDFAKWKTFGRGLPTVPVFELDYDGTDNVAVAGTLGRGAWKLSLSGFDDD